MKFVKKQQYQIKSSLELFLMSWVYQYILIRKGKPLQTYLHTLTSIELLPSNPDSVFDAML